MLKLQLKGTVHLFEYFHDKLNSSLAIDWYGRRRKPIIVQNFSTLKILYCFCKKLNRTWSENEKLREKSSFSPITIVFEK